MEAEARHRLLMQPRRNCRLSSLGSQDIQQVTKTTSLVSGSIKKAPTSYYFLTHLSVATALHITAASSLVPPAAGSFSTAIQRDPSKPTEDLMPFSAQSSPISHSCGASGPLPFYDLCPPTCLSPLLTFSSLLKCHRPRTASPECCYPFYCSLTPQMSHLKAGIIYQDGTYYLSSSSF